MRVGAIATKRVIFGGVAVLVIAALAAGVYGIRLPMMTEALVRSTVAGMGMAGPLMLIGLMVLAIVVSPIPIAVAAGALYGTLWGGVFVATGAILGASMAFGAARYLGFDAVRRSSNPVLKYIAAPRSQISLMLIIFTSRLIPFISFDAVSYAAGITCLSFARFAVATCLGVLPICFVLAGMGAGMAQGGPDWMWIVALGGGITLLPVAGKWLWDRAWTTSWSCRGVLMS